MAKATFRHRREKMLRAKARLETGIVQWRDPSGLVYVSRTVGGETFRIDGVAALFWMKLSGSPLDKVIGALADELGLDRDRLESDVVPFIERVVKLGFVRLSFE